MAYLASDTALSTNKRDHASGLEISPLNVLQLSRWLVESGGGGIQTYLRTLSLALDSKEVDLEYAALMPGERPAYANKPPRFGNKGLPKWRNALLLWRWLGPKLAQIDVVHIHGVTDWHFVVGVLACRYRKTPYVVRTTGGLFPEVLRETFRRRILSQIFMKLCGKPFLLSAHSVIASSSREANLLKGFDDRIRVRIIAHGVSVPSEMPIKESDSRTLLKLIFIGRIEPVKSLPTVLKALARLKSKGLHVHFDIVGSGDTKYVAGLELLVRDLEISDFVVLHGYQGGELKQSLLRDAHVLVLPSLSENFGFVVAEAMAQGTPVVVSDGVGVADQVLRYCAGSVFPVGDDEALANALCTYVDPDEVQACGERAYQCAINEFSLEAMGSALYEVYREAFNSRKGIVS